MFKKAKRDQTKLKEQNLKNMKGITLIALVITIIVLLILAGVAISMLSGENGILNRATEASEKTKEAGEQEELQLAITNLGIDYYTKASGKTLGEYVFENMDKLKEGLGESNIDADKDAKTITYKGKKYQVADDGEVKLLEEESNEDGEENKWDDILADANANPNSYKHPDQLTSTNIAIGTDGQPVNMDLWKPTKNADGTWSLGTSGGNYGYKVIYLEGCKENGGRIKGTVPQYIYNEDIGSFTTVTQMGRTFRGYSDLVYAPEIPSSVTSMDETFRDCTSLTEAPEIPSSVTDMHDTFYGCTSLTKAPVIPSGVRNMDGTFWACTSLTGTITINANPTSYTYCFQNTVQQITLTNSATEEKTATEATLNNLKGTANKGNVTVAPAK